MVGKALQQDHEAASHVPFLVRQHRAGRKWSYQTSEMPPVTRLFHLESTLSPPFAGDEVLKHMSLWGHSTEAGNPG